MKTRACFCASASASPVSARGGRNSVTPCGVAVTAVEAKTALVRCQTKWREHLIEVNLDPLGQAFRWFQGLRWAWDLRLDALETHLTKHKTD